MDDVFWSVSRPGIAFQPIPGAGQPAWVAGVERSESPVVEAHEADGESSWQFAPARFCNAPLRLTYNGDILWQSDNYSSNKANHYFSKHGVDRRDSIIDQGASAALPTQPE